VFSAIDQEETMPIRTVSNRGGNTIGRYPSLKLGRMVRYESLIERDLIYVLDFDPAISWFEEQPLTLKYRTAGQTRRYTPDFQVCQAGQMRLVECKPQTRVARPENQRKFAVARAWCEAQGWRFEVITEVQLAASQRVQNIIRLTRFARYPMASAFKQAVTDYLTTTHQPTPITTLMAQVAPAHPPRAWIPIMTMIYQHDLRVNLDETALSGESLVELAQPSISLGGER
jgi:hypothetical protein